MFAFGSACSRLVETCFGLVPKQSFVEVETAHKTLCGTTYGMVQQASHCRPRMSSWVRRFLPSGESRWEVESHDACIAEVR